MNLTESSGSDDHNHHVGGARTALALTARWRWAQAMLGAVVTASALAGSMVAGAATTTFGVLLDTDNNINSGCTISTADGSFAGVELVLNTTVVANSTGYRVTGITLQSCTGSSLSAPVTLDSAAYPVARGFGANGTSAVETYIPNAYLPRSGLKMRIGLTTAGADGIAGADAVLSSNGTPILFDAPPPIVVPTLSTVALGLTALLLALAVWYARRRGWHGMQLVVVAVFAVSLSGQIIAAIVRDGLITDWSGVTALATDPLGDAPAGTDVSALYATYDEPSLYFRIDAALNSPPVANAQTVVAVAGVVTPVTLSGTDYEGSPLTYTVITPPTHGNLTGTAPNLTYTANAGYGGTDSLVFRVNDGALDSPSATVTLDVKLPPTITSANTATFIPAQANSFNFTATAVPPATFALSACSPALPPSISVTNNGNNTATLAGNPSLGEGGTYVCTLTASNGFGANATQSFTLNLGLPPTFTSAANTTFTVGTAGSFAVTTTATPATTSITQSGTLPSGVTFVYNGPGTPLTGTLAGTPAAGTGGVYPITLTAANGIAPNTVQNFSLTVNQAPAITSANSTTCVVGAACSFTVNATGYPVPAIARGGAALPAGMTYVDNGNGTGTLAGTPTLASNAVNTYALTFTASNGVGAPAAQPFTLNVVKANQSITYTSTAPANASVGGATYTVTATASSGLTPAFTIDATATAVCSITGATVSFTGVGTCVINANQSGNADYNAAPQLQQSFAVIKGNQTISFTSTAPASAKVSGATYTVAATASPSGLPVAFTIDASAAAVCSIAGTTVSFVGAGTCVINANQAGNTNYNAAPQVQQTFLVAKGDQTITFTSTAPVNAKVAGTTYTVTAAAAPSGLPVAFSIDASAAGVCAISGTTVSFIAVGTCVVNANQAGNANYNAAPQVQQSFVVAKGDQTITFTSAAPANAKVAGATYTVTATAAPSALPVTFTIDATAAAVCSISGSTVSFIGAGSCVVNANQAGNANFNAAPQAQQTFAVAKGDQTITFTSTAPTAAKVAGATYNVTATASSGLSVTFTIDPSATAVCSIAGSTVTFNGVGTCVINANQAGNANYNAAPQVQQSFAVTKNDQTISFTSTAPVGAKVAGATYTVTATATSGLAVAFSIDPLAAAVCSIAGSTVSFIGAGTCVINANQAGNTNFNAAPQVQQTFAVAKGDQTITITSAAPAAVFGGATYTVTATASPSGLPVAFTIDASAASVCSVSGATVSFIGAGTCVINANQAGNGNYNAAPQVQQSFTVGKGDQTISFTSVAPASAQLGGPTYTVTATASPSGLPVAFSIDASAASVCSISGATVSFIGAGTCVINANQAGNANYNAAPQVQQSFTVSKAAQTITFTSTAPTAAKVAGATYNVTATASSGLSVTFTIDPSATAVCSIAGSTVTFNGVGTCVINANQAGNANYNAAPQVQQSFAVTKNDQTISFTSTAPVGAKVAGATYTVTATATSGLAVAFSIDPLAAAVCSIAGSTVSFIGAGTCVINANQAGNTNFNAAPQVQQTFAVAKGDQTITITSAAPAAVFGGATYTVTATASPSGLPVAFTIDASAASVCSVSGATVSFIGAGTCVINANQAGNGNYNAAPQVQQSFLVAKANQTISFTSSAPATPTAGGASYSVSATATSGLAVAFTIDASAASVCSVSGSTVSFIGAGTCVINANQAGNTNYNAAPQVQQSFIVKNAQTISFTSSPPATPTVGGATYAVTATATSGLTVTFSIDASATTVCSVAGSTVSFIGAGTCVINANQAGNGSYYAAPQVQQSFTVRRAQTITFTSAAPLAVYQGPTYTVTATATSALPVTFSIDATSSSVCTIAGAVVSFIGTGNCVINANQAGDATWYPAPQAQQTVTVGPNLQADNYNVVGNTQLVVAGHSAPTTPSTAAATGILANDTSDVAITLTTTTGAATTGGGSVAIDAAGKLTYTPPVGLSTGTDTYVYTGTSNGVSRTATITFNISNIVWYVNSSAAGGGDGRSQSPFNNMGASGLGSALSGAGPATSAYIYVYFGAGSTAGAYTLKSSQSLRGEAAGLTVGGLTIAATANRPVLTGTLSAVSGASGITVAGINMSTGTANAVDFANASADFTGGGMALTTTSGRAFSASGGGAVTVQGTGNTITTTTGPALNVVNTTIGAAGLTFRSISVNGASTGINLNGTGAGGLTVTGNSSGSCGGTVTSKNTVATAPVTSDCTGGTIQNAATGIRLNNAANVSLTRMRITGTSAHNFGIYATNTTNFSLSNSVIDGTIGATTAGQDAPLVFGVLDQPSAAPPVAGVNGLIGSNAITDSWIQGGIEHNVEIYGQSNNFGLTVTRTVVKSNSVGGGADGIQMELQGTAVGRVLVDNSQFDDNKSQAIQAAANGSSTVHFTLQNSRWSKTSQGNEGVLFSNGSNGQLFVDINNNLVPGTATTGFGGTAIFVGQTPGNATATSRLHARIRNNVVTTPQSSTNHSVIAFLTSTVGAASQGFVHVHDNTITQHSTGGSARGLLVDTPDVNTSPNFHATVLNNAVSWTDPALSLNALVVQARQASNACMHVAGNNAITASGSADLRVRQAGTAIANLFGSGANASAVLAANHTTPGVTTEVLGTVGLTGIACTTPTAPALP